MPLRCRIVAVVFTLALAAVALGCRKDSGKESASVAREPASSATIRSSELKVPGERGPTTGELATIDVPNDRPALVVLGKGDRATVPIVHLHGMCTEARSDLEAWSSSVRSHGTIIALEGDAACNTGAGGRTWSQSTDALDRRIDAAIAAVRAARSLELDGTSVIVIGESMGATRAVGLASKAPQKYARLVLVGPPAKLVAQKVEGIEAVAVLAGEREPQEVPRQNYDALTAAGMNATWWMLSDAMHGEYGPNGAATMGEALAFVVR